MCLPVLQRCRDREGVSVIAVAAALRSDLRLPSAIGGDFPEELSALHDAHLQRLIKIIAVARPSLDHLAVTDAAVQIPYGRDRNGGAGQLRICSSTVISTTRVANITRDAGSIVECLGRAVCPRCGSCKGEGHRAIVIRDHRSKIADHLSARLVARCTI